MLTASGRRGDARRVLVARERPQRRVQTRPWPARVGRWLGDGLPGLTIGYGLRPLRAFAWLLPFLLIGAALLATAEQASVVRPAPPVMAPRRSGCCDRRRLASATTCPR